MERDQRQPAFNEQLDTVGFCMLPALIPPAEVAGVRDESLAAHDTFTQSAESERRQRAAGHTVGVGVRGVTNLKTCVNHTRAWCPYLRDKRLVALVQHAFAGDEHWRVASCSVLVNNPGNAAGFVHADWPFNGSNGAHISQPYPDVTMALSVLVFLSDFTKAGGATRVFPRTHLRPHNPAGQQQQAEPCADTSVQVEGTA
eukprot:SAG31_NODE_6096_length_2172_cov_1.708635_3_plen_200_part_00